MTAIDELLARHTAAAPSASTAVPSLHVAVLTCMDTRINPYTVFGLRPGEAHILRNGGGVVTDDVIRSLVISQRKLETREVIIMQHTTCGLSGITEDGFKDEVEAATGLRPAWAVESFKDVETSVRQNVARVRRNPLMPHTDNVRGFVYDVATGAVTEVE